MKALFESRAGRFLRPARRERAFRQLAAFGRLSRLKFLAGGIAGGLFGTAMAAYESGRVAWGAYLLAQTTITALHLMTHYANDYFDRRSDRGARRTPFSGGSGALVEGSLAPVVALRAALGCATIGAAGALALWLAEDRPAAALFAAAIAVLAWGYSAPPLRLCARGLGELDTALVVAILVPLCAFAAQRGVPDIRALASTLPGAAAMFAMMIAVEYPDVAVDAAAGKGTLVVRLGVARARYAATAATSALYLAVAAAVAAGAPPAYAILQGLTLPLSASYLEALASRARAGPASDEVVAGTGVALFFIVTVYGVLGYTAGRN